MLKARDARMAELERERQSGLKTIRFAVKLMWIALKANVIVWLKPRFGVLRQYPPRPLSVPKEHVYSVTAGEPPKISIVTPSLNYADGMNDPALGTAVSGAHKP